MTFHAIKKIKDDGFTIVELLVGLVITFFIIGISLTYLVSSSRTFNVQTNDSVIQENARFALEVISQNIRLAGLNPNNVSEEELSTLSTLYAQSFCPDGEAGATDGSTTPGTAGCARDGADDNVQNNSDRFAVEYVLRSPGSTCNGQNVDQTMLDNNGGQLTLANIFWTADATDDADTSLSTGRVTRRALFCQTYITDSQIASDLTLSMSATVLGDALPIVDGIDRLQVQYGVDTDEDGLIDQYQSFSNLSNGGVVKAMRFGLLISSGLGVDSTNSVEEQSAQQYSVLDAAPDTFSDGVFRQIFSTTILVPNSEVIVPVDGDAPTGTAPTDT